jgi:predicted nucleic acid-binding Zn finger protein
MEKASKAHKLIGICQAIRAEGAISDTHIGLLEASFGAERVQKALDALNDSRIKRYVFQPSGRIVWIVVGKERDYLVMPVIDYCSCDDFYYQFDHGHICYHIIAQKLAESTGRFDQFEDDDAFFDILIREWKEPEEQPPPKKKPAESNSDDTV